MPTNAKRYRIFGLLLLSLLLCPSPAAAQYREHLIGLKAGYGILNVRFKPDYKQKAITSYKDFSLLYTYYHDLWGHIPYFGLQTGVNYTESGFRIDSLETRYQVIQIPLTSQFHIDFWKMRLLINLGYFGGYRLSAQQDKLVYGNKETHDYVFDAYDRRWDFGFMGGGGIALHLHPVEFQLECNYQYALSMLYNPRKNSNENYIYTYPNKLTFSLAVFIHL